ncbi:Nn.00g079850.m01.CDS01 [Neocucurbitaria sp. VM-36]
MLLFYEDEPDSARATTSTSTTDNPPIQTIDPLSQYGSHAFIPYLPSSQPSPSSQSITAIPPPPQEEPLTLHNSSSWTYCGPLLQPLSTSLPSSFHTWSALTISNPPLFLSRLLPLLAFLHTFHLEAGAQNYWLTLRATKPTSDYDTPRWHTDANFFDAEFNAFAAPGLGMGMEMGTVSTQHRRCWKLATTLLGPPTLFQRDNAKALTILRRVRARKKGKMGDHTCTSIRCLGCATYAQSVRDELATALPNAPFLPSSSSSSSSSRPTTTTAAAAAVHSPYPNELSFFRIGDSEGAVHSEPKCDVDRIFVNVIPGTEEDLRALLGRWGMGFPRAWCFGVPVGFVGSDEGERVAEGVGGERTEGTMSGNLGEEYRLWLERSGIKVAKVFGKG